MKNQILTNAIEMLSRDFDAIVYQYIDVPSGDSKEKTLLWPGLPTEDVMISVYKGTEILEPFHRQNFFFFNFAWEGDFSALSHQYNNRITVHEGECYIGQPYSGYAVNDKSKGETIIISVLIQTEAFFKTYFHILSAETKLFHFFLNPQINKHSEEYILLKFDDDFSVRRLLELMVVEYANPQENTQEILKSLTLSLMMQIARQYKNSSPEAETQTLTGKIINYIGEHIDSVTLQDVARHFSYHPNYISTLLPKEIGKTFSEILLEQRMERAIALLKGTNLPVSEIAELLGYSNSSNFYKSFRKYYGSSPKKYSANLS